MLAFIQINIISPLIRYYHTLLPRNKAGDVLQIESARDLSPLYKAFSAEDDKDSNPIFLYSSFRFITNQYIAYFSKSSHRKYNLTLKDIRESLQHLLDDDVYLKAPQSITKFILLINSNIFIKGLKLHKDFISIGLLLKLILQEAKLLKLLLHSLHLNIIQYHGYLIKRSHIVSITLE